MLVAQHLPDLVLFHRPADQETLNAVTPHGTQNFQMLRGLHPFRHHTHVEAVRHFNNGAGDGGVVRVLGQIGNEGAVDLQRVHREAFEVAERGIAGAEIIQRQADSP